MRRPLPLLALVLALVAPRASPQDGFETLKQRAERLESLSTFLERFVGECRDAYEQRTCERNVQAQRRSYAGKLLYASVADNAGGVLRAESRGERFRIFITPFIDGGGYALTHGQPRRQDSAGHPLIDYVVIEGEKPAGTADLEFQSAFRSGRVEMELVFRPEGIWKLRRKGEPGYYAGVRARFLGVRLVDSRTGAEIASKLL